MMRELREVHMISGVANSKTGLFLSGGVRGNEVNVLIVGE
jgi:hypothetical protein